MKYILQGFGLAFLIIGALSVFSPHKREQRQIISQSSAELSGIPDEFTGPRYHEVTTLPNGAKVGTLGALSYLLDAYGDPLTQGYQHIAPENGGYVARNGATTYRLNSRGQIVYETNARGDTTAYKNY